MKRVTQNDFIIGKWYLIYRYPVSAWYEIHLVYANNNKDYNIQGDGFYWFFSSAIYTMTHYSKFTDDYLLYESSDYTRSIFELSEEEVTEHIVLNFC